ncbi:hypothetical protein GCM10010149_84780 [Nonomuraea roseoviolacea subsp. roseoviolacea]|uniref:CPBP family intramembrane glutamic endopeptidase n=1 Tax=Nonomuraea roseoviolacea TaxID=103837 RepID=UPI0031D31671
MTLVLAEIIIFFGYYYAGKKLLLRLARHCAEKTVRWGLSRSVLEKTALYELVLVVASHILVVVALLAWRGSVLPGLGVDVGTLVLLPFGAALGVAQMVTSIFICQVLISAIGAGQANERIRRLLRLSPAQARAISPAAWTDYSRAGWMRHHLVARTALPGAASVLLTTLQVTCEEIVFRGVFPLLVASSAWGLDLGLWVSGVLFVLMQAFFMPSWRSAMFPLVGAAMMAATHGCLYASTGKIWPLVVAHAVSFFAAAKQP